MNLIKILPLPEGEEPMTAEEKYSSISFAQSLDARNQAVIDFDLVEVGGLPISHYSALIASKLDAEDGDVYIGFADGNFLNLSDYIRKRS